MGRRKVNLGGGEGSVQAAGFVSDDEWFVDDDS